MSCPRLLSRKTTPIMTRISGPVMDRGLMCVPPGHHLASRTVALIHLAARTMALLHLASRYLMPEQAGLPKLARPESARLAAARTQAAKTQAAKTQAAKTQVGPTRA